MKDKNKLSRVNFKQLKLKHLKRKVLTINNIMYVVAKIMIEHKGIENSITSDELFKQVYGSERKADYVDDFRWDYVRKAMHRLRQRTKLFVASQRTDEGVFVYFVPTTVQEAQIYIDNIERNITRMRSMQRKAMKSVIDKWYELDWVEENKILSSMKEIVSAQKQVKFDG